MIRFIVITYTSARDVNGNCYHFAKITSTKTGATLHVHSYGERNTADAIMRDLECDVYAETVVLPKREWKRRNDTVKHYEWEPGFAELVENLEKA